MSGGTWRMEISAPGCSFLNNGFTPEQFICPCWKDESGCPVGMINVYSEVSWGPAILSLFSLPAGNSGCMLGEGTQTWLSSVQKLYWEEGDTCKLPNLFEMGR